MSYSCTTFVYVLVSLDQNCRLGTMRNQAGSGLVLVAVVKVGALAECKPAE